ncbi:hypothetical protein GXP67_09085 [Rhodocytophaga rosea]|uniref:Uncharacterized protein n=1 Tax=Rhodocytophaga rosea TaxID=2704465 RepID=A0A6C0GGJ6_9BACT|nr:hypothetical protein [Rhodocytophaga rosea]QHT66800.1 hypothetical protein GXP67_09085 [Rhodocytophaga rosea]
MKPFWQLIINIRDFGYHWSVKQYDEESAASEYKNKVIVFLSGYLATLLFTVVQALSYFGMGIRHMPVGKTDPWWMKVLAGGVIFLLPLFLVKRYVLKRVEHIPIPIEYSPQQYRKYSWIFWGGFLLGWLLAIGVGMYLIAYLRGREIHLFNLIINEGGRARTFKEDFNR